MLWPVDRAMPASTNGAAVSSLANCSTLAGVLSHSASNSASALCTGTVSRGARPGRWSSGHCGACTSSRTGTGA